MNCHLKLLYLSLGILAIGKIEIIKGREKTGGGFLMGLGGQREIDGKARLPGAVTVFFFFTKRAPADPAGAKGAFVRNKPASRGVHGYLKMVPFERIFMRKRSAPLPPALKSNGFLEE